MIDLFHQFAEHFLRIFERIADALEEIAKGLNK